MSSLVETFTSDHDQKLAFKIAWYNAIFVVILAIAAAGLFAVYNMLYMFLTPMLWAVLIGTVLFPLKRRISSIFKGWLDDLDDHDTPLLIGVLLLPYNHFIAYSDYVLEFLSSKQGFYAIGTYIALKVLSYERTFMVLLSWVGGLYQFVDSVIDFLTGSRVFVPLILLYALCYGAWLYVQDPQSVHKKFARSLSLPIWIFGLAFISDFFGPLRVVSFVVSALTLILVSVGVIGAADDESGSNTPAKDEKDETSPPSVENIGATIEDNLINTAKASEAITPADLLPETASGSSGDSQFDHAISSDTHIQVIFGLCVLIWTVRHEYMLFFVIVPFLIALSRQIGSRLGVFDAVSNAGQSLWETTGPRVQHVVHIVVAGPLRKFIKLVFTSDRLFVSSLQSRVDLISSIVVMALLAFGSVMGFLITAYELHNETVHLVKLGSNVVSSNPEWLRYAVNYTEDQLAEHDIDNYVEQAYQQGRAWVAANIRSLADPKDTARADELEDQAKFLVDNLYHIWEERNAQVPNASSQALTSSDGDWLGHLTKATNLEALKGEVTAIVTDNIETVLSIAKSLWSVIILNVSVLSTIVFSILGFVLGFGFDLLNFLIEIIVFLTIVYYLLANSSDRWLPLTWMQLLTSSINTNTSDNSGNKADITSAIELAISSVFVLSAKMAVFYGLYTYFVHSLFDLNIVFVPSLMAAIFAAIPIVPPYSVLVFGAVELFIIRQEVAAGIVFALMCVAPLGFADAAFYREVKGSHPYVTGLAIIGGMYWLGLQGAIIGPIILCSMLALVNVYAQFPKA
uniref:Histidine kinase n=1 Tax=Panagrellus redivivus TaxID=6233 RepID=A0A7E4UX04_PANRE